MVTEEQKKLIDKINKLKKKKNAIILVHNYQRPEIYEIADFMGDSLELSKAATKTDAKIIVFCGVDFMAQSAAILNPEKKVLIPEMDARCPMAAMITVEGLKELKARHPKAAVVAYVNTTADIKAESDIGCTSANAIKVVNSLDEEEVIFVPDKYLARWVEMNSKKKIIPWNGYCIVHKLIDGEKLNEAKKEHPDAKIVVHPECQENVLRQADKVASTSQMITYCQESDAKEFIIGTEIGMLEILKRKCPGKTFYAAPGAGICINMKKITLEKTYNCLDFESNQVIIPENIRVRAKKSLDRMLEVS